MQACKKCGATARNRLGKCRPCMARHSKEWKARQPKKPVNARSGATPCKICGSVDRNPSGKCRPCCRRRYEEWATRRGSAQVVSGRADYYKDNRERVLGASKIYYHTNKKKITERWLLKRYGITPNQYDQLLLDQLGRCWLCDRPMLATPSVDHDHTTGVIRGLAHNSCNRAFGILREDPEIFEILAAKARALVSQRREMECR